MPAQPTKDIEIIPNPRPGKLYEVDIECPEFTCLCPRTGQPDFATLRVHYVPNRSCLELKSLKLYFWSFRQEGAFHEEVVNRILEDLVEACQPKRMTVVGDFNVRGGLHTVVKAEFQAVDNVAE